MVLGVPMFEPIIIRQEFAQVLGPLEMTDFPFGTIGKFVIFEFPSCYALGVSGLAPPGAV